MRCRGVLYVCAASVAASLAACSFLGFGPSEHIIHYRVEEGDTLSEIGKRFGVSVKRLEDLNSIDDPRALPVGAMIEVPLASSKAAISGYGVLGGHRTSRTSQKSVRYNLSRKYIGNLAWPIRDGRIASDFGNRGVKFHEGVDISARRGTPIRAAHAGTVVYADDTLNGYGNVIVLKGDGLVTIYGHNEENLVEEGAEVKRGDVIARVGSSGRASGPHLHFETRIKDPSGQNIAVDPMVFYPGQ